MKATTKEQRTRPLTSDFVRYLGAFEHLHWLFSQSGPRAFAHGALCSAVTHAARMTSSAWRQETLRLLSPINARKQCGVGNTSSMCIGAAIISIAPGQEPDLWSLARRKVSPSPL